ncbi:low density lipoprotein receptor adapter protein 1-like isoform X2 [Ascaphus truei]|uniref:low density lipoprotein receptor adapter protein 1-like isoform X2 n=1 Tax=Ascaphus truei TaxID=8439 RepID=UPI003F59405E
MDALKSAGKAILRSPSIARHSLRVTRHHKLPENWTDTKETLLEGMVFHLKYLGMTLVEKPKGEDMAASAIRRIITMARVGAKKFQKVTLTVTPRGISLQDAATEQLIENVSIYRISYCTTDKVQNKVFAYVAQNQSNETLECHAFLSPKKKMAQAVTLTVAQAFNVALDLWESAKEGHVTGTESQTDSMSSRLCAPGSDALSLHSTAAHHPQRGASPGHPTAASPCTLQPGEEDDDDLDEAFSRLAESRTSEPCASVPVTPDHRG